MHLITLMCLCSLWQKWKKLLSSCKMFLQGISTSLLKTEIRCLVLRLFLLMTMNLQELGCCGWAWKSNIFLRWVGNRMELLWIPSFCKSVRTSNLLLGLRIHRKCVLPWSCKCMVFLVLLPWLLCTSYTQKFLIVCAETFLFESSIYNVTYFLTSRLLRVIDSLAYQECVFVILTSSSLLGFKL